MFKSLSDAICSLFGTSTNDTHKTTVGSKRKRNVDENYDDPDVQITRIEKKRRTDFDSSSNSFFSFNVLKKSASRMADFIKPKQTFSKAFDIHPIEHHSRWGNNVSNKNGNSNQSRINGDEGHLANHSFQEHPKIVYSKGFQNNGGVEEHRSQNRPQPSQHSANTSLFRNNRKSEASKCIQLKEKEEYQKLLQLQFLRSPWQTKVTIPALSGLKTSSSAAKDSFDVPGSYKSSSSSASQNSFISIPQKRPIEIISVTPSYTRKTRDLSQISSLKLLLAEQRRRDRHEVLAHRSHRQENEHKLNQENREENLRKLTESNERNSQTSAIVIEDDDENRRPIGNAVSSDEQAKKDVQSRDKTEQQSDKKSFLQSKYLFDKEQEDRKQMRINEQEARRIQIEEQELKARAYAEKRRAQDISLERQLKYQMRIFEEEPGVTEEIFRDEEEEEKEEEFPELTDEMLEVVARALRPGNPNELLSKAFGLQITRGDIATLSGLNWLNDEVINFYMNMLMERGEKSDRKVYAFNTFFYPKIMSGGHSAVKRWTKKVDIFAMKYIIIPVHLGMHWCLCIVDIDNKAITYYDSMGGKNHNCLRAVLSYLKDESTAKNYSQFKESEWQIQHAENNPHQMNGGDCGMFMCKYAEYITRGKAITFTQEHMPYFRKRMVYEIMAKMLLQ
ncbi:unnamed protein product [Lymnaea stagnalis]|uniref:Ubiquitin-like protease family profile domain-containing protein n=1 Tax=Lymnaea stagnalis TaxID=6523 RepID=A0AAV2IK68_LYMST